MSDDKPCTLPEPCPLHPRVVNMLGLEDEARRDRIAEFDRLSNTATKLTIDLARVTDQRNAANRERDRAHDLLAEIIRSGLVTPKWLASAKRLLTYGEVKL